MVRSIQARPGASLVELELDRFGFDHTTLGACVAERWNLPEAVVAAIRYHHAPRYHGVHAPTVACVELANVLVTAKGIPSVGAPLGPLSPSVVEHLGVGREDVRRLVDQMNQQILDHGRLFALTAA